LLCGKQGKDILEFPRSATEQRPMDAIEDSLNLCIYHQISRYQDRDAQRRTRNVIFPSSKYRRGCGIAGRLTGSESGVVVFSDPLDDVDNCATR
jgi:hypothetical protein